MKTKLIIFIALLVTLTTVAQQGINYKAIIKDNMGNVVANQSVTIQFIILEDATNVYQETHTPTTDANGIVIVNIGEGTTSDVFTDINWSADAHFLNVQINTGSGLTDMGTTQFMAVPYALNAANVSGLEALDEGNGIGWRLVGRDPNNYGNIGISAVDLSISSNSSSSFGATGENSFAMGALAIASGDISTAMGINATASGDYSTAFGNSTIASGFISIAGGSQSVASASYSTAIGYQSTANQTYALAMGESTTSSGISSVAMGAETTASGNSSFAMGDSNTAAGNSSVALGFLTNVTNDYSFAMGNTVDVSGFASSAFGYHLINDDTRSMVIGQYNDNTTTSSSLFMVGNGVSDINRTNAFTVLANGKILAPSFDIAEITDDKALITKEYLEANSSSASGLEAIDEGNGIGWRLVGRDPYNHGNIGENAVDLSYSGIGNGGFGATGQASISFGNITVASGQFATAMGSGTIASGLTSTAIGLGTISDDYSSTVVGTFNDNTTSTTTLFQVGNGTSLSTRSNAFTVYQNGNIEMGYATTASGNRSTAMGNDTTASGDYSTAIGSYNIASGNSSTAIGSLTSATAYTSTVMGYSTISDDDYSLVIGKNNNNTFSTTTLFQIGNGFGDLFRTNAFTVLQNGYTSVGTHDEEPTTDFQVYHDNVGTVNGFKLQNKGANENWWRFYTLNSNGYLYLYSKAGGNSNAVGSFNDVSGAYTALSDRRVKDNFEDLYFNWESFMQLKTLTYFYKTDENKQSNIGFIAQDVKSIYPELVNYNQEDDLYQLNYSGFGVVAIKAIQELKKEVKVLTEENAKLKDIIAKQEALEARLLALEGKTAKNLNKNY